MNCRTLISIIIFLALDVHALSLKRALSDSDNPLSVCQVTITSAAYGDGGALENGATCCPLGGGAGGSVPCNSNTDFICYNSRRTDLGACLNIAASSTAAGYTYTGTETVNVATGQEYCAKIEGLAGYDCAEASGLCPSDSVSASNSDSDSSASTTDSSSTTSDSSTTNTASMNTSTSTTSSTTATSTSSQSATQTTTTSSSISQAATPVVSNAAQRFLDISFRQKLCTFLGVVLLATRL